ncbi:MAG: ParB/RepB/Spo0J family partition protein [Terriglobia bacterium]
MTRQALGKGLSALLKDREATSEPELRELDLDLLEPNPYQPRQVFEEAKLEELSQSIRLHGFVQPLIVRKQGARFQIIAGERRWRAAQRLGLLRIPVLVREISNEKLLEVSLIENIQRENLNPIEEARAYSRLAHEFGLTQEEVAERTGKERSTVANFLRLLKLPKEIQEMLQEGTLSMGHARALLGIDSHAEQRKMADKVKALGWSVRQLEKSVAASKNMKGESKAADAKPQDPNVRAAIENLERRLGTRVRIIEHGSGGKIEIEYYSQEELQRIYEQLTR